MNQNISGQMMQPPKKDNSILAFCVGNVGHRAKTTQMTREYQKLNPSRYKVKSKVQKNIRVQEKDVTKKFDQALQKLFTGQH